MQVEDKPKKPIPKRIDTRPMCASPDAQVVTNTDYPDNQTATIDLEINSDLVDTRGVDDKPATRIENV